MSESTVVKIYLIDEDFQEIEVRKFDVLNTALSDYMKFSDIISAKFPELSKEAFTLYWQDDENDKLTISSKEELLTALKEMPTEVKRYFVKPKLSARQNEEADVDSIHPHIYCDICNNCVSGFRYKCLVCRNYDLCSECERAGAHREHPMLRIPSPFLLDYSDICKVMRYFSSYASKGCEAKRSRQRRKHSQDHSFSHKKKKYDKYESGPETGEESDDNRRKKHSRRTCVYSQLMSDFFRNIDASHFHQEIPKAAGSSDRIYENPWDSVHFKNLKSMVKTFTSLFNNLGVDVDVEVRPGQNEEANKKKQTEKPEEEEKTRAPPSAPTFSPILVKEVRFGGQEQNAEILKQKVEEITKILANQRMNQSPENDGWVSFEELERSSVEPQPSTSTETPSKISVIEPQAPQVEKTVQEAKNIYPILKNDEQMHTSPVVRSAVEKMLAMGFTNDGGWLTHLLETKNGDISQALEVLAPHKK